MKVLIENLMSQTQRYSYSILHLIEEGLAKSTSQWNAPVTRCCLVSYVVIHIDFACVSRIRLFLAHARGGEAVEEYSNEGLKWVRGDLCVEEASVAPLGLQDSWGTTSISFWHVAVAEKMICKSHFGLFCHRTPKKYTGTPVAMIPNPIAHSTGVFQMDTTMRNMQANTKTMGSRMLTSLMKDTHCRSAEPRVTRSDNRHSSLAAHFGRTSWSLIFVYNGLHRALIMVQSSSFIAFSCLFCPYFITEFPG